MDITGIFISLSWEIIVALEPRKVKNVAGQIESTVPPVDLACVKQSDFSYASTYFY